MIDLKFYEKLLISLVVFVLVLVATVGIIGNFVKLKNREKEQQKNSIILETVNLF